MRINKENINSYIESAKMGDKIYSVSGTNINQHVFLCEYKSNHGFYAYWGADVTKAQLFSIYSIERTYVFTTYDEAKEQIYDNALSRVNSINKIYFDNTKQSLTKSKSNG